jgi:RimJ/RimL family protein N-acetyltransferase
MIADFPHWADIYLGPSAPFIGGPFTRDDAFVDFMASVGNWPLRGFGPWTVDRLSNGETVGFVILGFEPGDREVELGFLFRPVGEGLGLAFEAASVIRDHARDTLCLPSLVSYVADGNDRSARLAARLGAVADGRVDGCTVWRHWGPVAQDRVLPRVETEGRRMQDAKGRP